MSGVLYARGFPSSFNHLELKAKFSEFGNVKKARVISDGKKLFGIVKFVNRDHANIAIQELHDKTVDGIAWYVVTCEMKRHRKSICSRKYFDKRQKTVYLRDFPDDLTQEKLREIFEKHGTIESVFIGGKAALIVYSDSYSARSAIWAEKKLEIDGKRVYVDRNKSKLRMTELILQKKNSRANRNNLDTIEAANTDNEHPRSP